MMKIKIMSDIHLEFGWLDVPTTPDDKDTILVLAGDIGIASKIRTYQEFVEDMSMRFQDVIYIMGNHEHYHGKFPTTKQKLLDAMADCANVHILEKESLVIDDVAFVCASLWTNMGKFDPFVMLDAGSNMHDYDCIRNGPTHEPWKCKLTPQDTVADHLNAVEYIFTEIEKQQEAGNKIVVVTHHGPSWQSVAEQYKGQPLNGAYVSDLDDKIIEAKAELWIHGHTHVSFDYSIGDTRIVVNPRGYFGVPTDLNPEFDLDFIIEL